MAEPKLLATMALGLGGLCGCAQGLPKGLPDWPVTKHAWPGHTYGAAGAAAADAPIGDTMSLAQAYKLALARSEDVALAEREVEDAHIASTETLTEVAPTVTATVNAYEQREHSAGMTVLRPSEQLVGSLVINQPLFRRGFFDSRASGKYRVESASASLKREREALAHDVAAVFIDVVKFRRLLELAHSSVTRATSQYTFAVGRVKSGGALKNSELLAQIDVKRAQRQEVNAQRDADAAEVAFTRIVGRAAPPKLELPPMPTLPDDKRGLELTKRRSDLEALELRVREAQADESVAAGKRLWPRLDLTATAQYLDPQVFNSNFDLIVLGSITIPLLQGGREYTELSKRESATHVATLVVERSRKLALEESEVAALRIASATKAEGLAKQELETANEHYALVDKQIKLGAITFLEVTNAQAVLVEAENAFATATVDKLRAAYDYMFAIGALDLDAAK